MGNHAVVLGSNKINHSEALITFPTSSTELVGTDATQTLTNKSIVATQLTGTIDHGRLPDSNNARTALGLAIGTDVVAYSANLNAISGLTSAADKGIQYTGSGTAGLFDLTAAEALLDDADAAAQRTTLGLGTMATATATDYLARAGGVMTGALRHDQKLNRKRFTLTIDLSQQTILKWYNSKHYYCV